MKLLLLAGKMNRMLSLILNLFLKKKKRDFLAKNTMTCIYKGHFRMFLTPKFGILQKLLPNLSARVQLMLTLSFI